jgi:hypothetical protein
VSCFAYSESDDSESDEDIPELTIRPAESDYDDSETDDNHESQTLYGIRTAPSRHMALSLALSFCRVREAIAGKIMSLFHVHRIRTHADIFSKHLGWEQIWKLVRPLVSNVIRISDTEVADFDATPRPPDMIALDSENIAVFSTQSETNPTDIIYSYVGIHAPDDRPPGYNHTFHVDDDARPDNTARPPDNSTLNDGRLMD